jgi:periplasmic mercuric ion binding protein
MKSKVVLFVISLFIITTAMLAQTGIVEIKIKTSAVCDMCKETLEKAMAYEKGVKSSNLDVESAVITVNYNAAKTNPDKIRKAISEAGYDADDVKANEKAYSKLNACCKKDAHPERIKN